MSRTIRQNPDDDHSKYGEKPWWKSDKEFKKIRRCQDRSRARQAMREDRDPDSNKHKNI